MSITAGELFPNKLFYSWTHGGLYYAIGSETPGMEVSESCVIWVSPDKFKYSWSLVGKFPFYQSRTASIYTSIGYPSEIECSGEGNNLINLSSLLVRGSNIFVQYDNYDEESNQSNNITVSEKTYYYSRSYGALWSKLENVVTEFPGYLTDLEVQTHVWRKGTFAFMVTDSRECYTYFFKPLFKRNADDNTVELADWYVHRSDDVIINNPSDPAMNVLIFPNRFLDSGTYETHYTNTLNNMDNHHEKFRKPYIVRWPQMYPMQSEADVTETYDHSGFLVNPFDTVHYNYNNENYAISRVPYEVSIRSGLIADSGNQFNPDYFTARIPVFYCINVDALERATTGNKVALKTLDIIGFSEHLTGLHSVQYTLRGGIYSFFMSLLGPNLDLHNLFGEPGTVYPYSSEPSDDAYSKRVFLKTLVERCSGDIMKINDPSTGFDVAAVIFGNRVKVCSEDPSSELNWVDKTRDDTYSMPVFRGYTDSTMSVSTGETETVELPLWCPNDTVLRYDYENCRLLGYPKYTPSGELYLTGYSFPAFIKSSSGYSVGYYGTDGYVTADGPQYKEEIPAIGWRYGGFVAASRGFVGSLAGYLKGVDIPEEPENPPVIVITPEIPEGEPLDPPVTIAILDDVKKTTTTIISSDRKSVEFTPGYVGGALSNIAVQTGKYYLEVSNMVGDLYFGLAKANLDVNAGPSNDTNAIVVDANHRFYIGGKKVVSGIDADYLYSPGNYDCIGLLIDMDSKILSFITDDGMISESSIGGLPDAPLYFYVGVDGGVSKDGDPTVSSITVNFGDDLFNHTVPAGFKYGFGI